MGNRNQRARDAARLLYEAAMILRLQPADCKTGVFRRHVKNEAGDPQVCHCAMSALNTANGRFPNFKDGAQAEALGAFINEVWRETDYTTIVAYNDKSDATRYNVAMLMDQARRVLAA